MTKRSVKDKSTPPFVQVDIRLITALTNAEFKIYAQIKRRAGEDGECWSSLENMAKETGNSVSTLQRSLKTLKRLGLIAKIRRPGETDVYELTPPEKWNLPSHFDRTNPGQNDLSVRSKRPEGFGHFDRTNPGQNDLLNRSLIDLDPNEVDPRNNLNAAFKPHTPLMREAENQKGVSDQNFSADFWQNSEPPIFQSAPINQPTVNQAPTTSSATATQGSAPRERESFSSFPEMPVFGQTRRVSNLEKPRGQWIPRWREGMGPNQWHEGFVGWLTSNMFSGAKRSRGDVVAYLRKREADPTGASLQDIEAKFDDYERSWAARTGNSADDEWKELSKLVTQVMEKKNVA
jgi:predicted transcriptional regulator